MCGRPQVTSNECHSDQQHCHPGNGRYEPMAAAKELVRLATERRVRDSAVRGEAGQNHIAA